MNPLEQEKNDPWPSGTTSFNMASRSDPAPIDPDPNIPSTKFPLSFSTSFRPDLPSFASSSQIPQILPTVTSDSSSSACNHASKPLTRLQRTHTGAVLFPSLAKHRNSSKSRSRETTPVPQNVSSSFSIPVQMSISSVIIESPAEQQISTQTISYSPPLLLGSLSPPPSMPPAESSSSTPQKTPIRSNVPLSSLASLFPQKSPPVASSLSSLLPQISPSASPFGGFLARSPNLFSPLAWPCQRSQQPSGMLPLPRPPLPHLPAIFDHCDPLFDPESEAKDEAKDPDFTLPQSKATIKSSKKSASASSTLASSSSPSAPRRHPHRPPRHHLPPRCHHHRPPRHHLPRHRCRQVCLLLQNQSPRRVSVTCNRRNLP